MSQPIDELYGVFSNYSTGKPFVEQFLIDTKEQAVEKFTALCDQYEMDTTDKDTLVEIYRRWKPNQEMGLGHHDFIEASKKIFEKMYPKVSMRELQETVRNNFIAKNTLDSTSPVVQELDERFPGIPRTIETFEQEVMEQVAHCGVDLTNEDTRLKVKCVILSNYREIQKNVHNLMIRETVTDEQKELEKSSEEKDKLMLKLLQTLEVPKDLVMHKIKQESLWQVANSVADVRNALLWEQSQIVADELEKLSGILGKESSDYYEKYMKADINAFRVKSAVVIEGAEAALAEADKRRS